MRWRARATGGAAVRTWAVVAVAGSVALVAGSCGNGRRAIWATDYDQSCTEAADCVVVLSGECGACGAPCDAGAVNREEQSEYEADFNALSCEVDDSIECSPCPIKSHEGVVDAEATEAYSGAIAVVACEGGSCVVSWL